MLKNPKKYNKFSKIQWVTLLKVPTFHVTLCQMYLYNRQAASKI